MGQSIQKVYCERTKASFENFCTKTTINGFSEIHLAKNWLWRIVWLAITLAAIGLSAHQSFEIVLEYLERPTITKIEMYDHGQPYYPPLKICYIHWMFWLDYSKANRIGLNKSTLLTALSYLKHVYSESEFNVDDVRADLFDILHTKRLINVHDFVSAISADNPPGFHLPDGYPVNFTKSLFSIGHRPYTDLCYILKSSDISKILAMDSTRILHLRYNKTDRSAHLGDMLTSSEYVINGVMEMQASMKVNDVDPKYLKGDLYFPPFFSFDGQSALQSAISFAHSAYRYQIKISGRVYRWLNGVNSPCRPLIVQADDYESCVTFCYQEATKLSIPDDQVPKYLTALEVALDKNATMHQVCPFRLFFSRSDALKYQIYYGDQKSSEFTANLEMCKKNKCYRACEEWIFDGIVSKMDIEFSLQDLGVPTFIELHYPPTNTIVAHEQQISQNWVSFMGNVGGVIGLWLGASVLSFLQAIYLCCNCNRIE